VSARAGGLPVYLGAATLLRVSAEGMGTALVLTVQARTGHAATAGFLQTAMTLPYVLSGPLIGHAFDRTARPRAVAAGLMITYVLASGLLLLAAGNTPLALGLAVALVVGCTEPIVVGLTSLLPRFVPSERLTRAYGLEASSYNLAGIAGPGLAAAVAAGIGGGQAGVPIVACAAVALFGLPLIPFRPPEGDSGGDSSFRSVAVGGLVVLWTNRVLRALTVATTLAWLGFGGVAVTAVLLAQRVGASPSAGGVLLVALAVGSLIGSLASARWLTLKRAETVMLAGLVAFGTALACLALAPSLGWAVAFFLLAGVSEGPVFASTLMLRQRESPPDRLGQVNTTGGSLKIAASAVGAALTGAFADAIGVVGLVIAIACFQFAGVLLGFVILRRPWSKT
jgi:MFS family permease